jgi:hypothetical protein
MLVRRHPQEAVELPFARLGERVRTFEVDRLPREHLHGTCPSRQFVVRQVRVEVEGRYIPQESKTVEVVERCQRSNFVCAFHKRRPKAVGVVYRNAKPVHERSRVLPKPLLARHERIPVVQIFHLALLHVAGEADIMMRREQETGAVPLQPFADRGDLLRRGLLFGQNVIEPEYHQRVGVGENAFVDLQPVSGLVNALEDSDRVARRFTGYFLKTEG